MEGSQAGQAARAAGALSQHFKPLICPVDSNIQTELKEGRERGRKNDYLQAMQGVAVMCTIVSDVADGSVEFMTIIYVGWICCFPRLIKLQVLWLVT